MDYTAAKLCITFFLISTLLFQSRCQQANTLGDCDLLISCGSITNLSYPFWEQGKRSENCGHPGFELRCEAEDHFVMDIGEDEFRVMNISQARRTMTIARSDLWESDNLCRPLRNLVMGSHFFAYSASVANLSLAYNCSHYAFERYDKKLIGCDVQDQHTIYMYDTYLGSEWSYVNEHCVGETVKVAVSRVALEEIERGELALIDGLRRGYEVNYENFDQCRQCNASGDICKFSATELLCIHRRGRSLKVKMVIGMTSGGSAILLICITLCCRKTIKGQKSFLIHIKSKRDQDVEAFIRNNRHLELKRYRFYEVKKITGSFKDKLGKGGYGEVYRGTLSDGQLVAVKLLNSQKSNGEDFINEVASISRTSHVNVVGLLGFCIDDGRRALIYEFMPNGSLEKFTCVVSSSQSNPNLEWNKLLEIVTGVARGLEYLHRGCSTRILHFDIKPHNILLDEDFCPKISDFGLAKLCPGRQSNISLMDARGTIGYIAPEVFSRNFGNISSKSDVYSYGMLVLEMVGGRNNVKVGLSRTSEIYFPDWIYDQLTTGAHSKIWGDIKSDENRIARKMIIVGLWCIQLAPSERPSMSKVIEMLEGSLESLEIPPKPTLSLPTSLELLNVELNTGSSATSIS